MKDVITQRRLNLALIAPLRLPKVLNKCPVWIVRERAVAVGPSLHVACAAIFSLCGHSIHDQKTGSKLKKRGIKAMRLSIDNAA